MTDFECVMQIMGKDAKTEIKEFLMYLVKTEIQEAFEDGWVFPVDDFKEFMQDIVDETERELREQYKEQIKEVLERELLKALHLDKWG